MVRLRESHVELERLLPHRPRLVAAGRQPRVDGQHWRTMPGREPSQRDERVLETHPGIAPGAARPRDIARLSERHGGALPVTGEEEVTPDGGRVRLGIRGVHAHQGVRDGPVEQAPP
jgi:hypothetical protein